LRPRRSDTAVCIDADEKFHKFGGILDSHLERRDHLVGYRLTFADLWVASYPMYAEQARLPLEP